MPVICGFADRATEEIFDGDRGSLRARRRLPVALWKVAARKFAQLGTVRNLGALAWPPGNRLESLRGTRAGQHSIRINAQYRICFRWTDGGPADVEITDYH